MKFSFRYASARCAAFSLIELLTVIAIVVVLFSILVVVQGQVRQRAEITQCAANLRQIGVASNLYLAEHNGEFFPKKDNSVFNFVGATVRNRTDALERPLNSYLGIVTNNQKVEVAACPSQKGRDSYTSRGTSYNSNHFERRGSLSIITETGGQVSYSPEDSITKRSIRFSDVVNPSKFVIAMEHGAEDAIRVSEVQARPLRSHWPDENRFNLLFADGHVDAVKLINGEWNHEAYNFSCFEN